MHKKIFNLFRLLDKSNISAIIFLEVVLGILLSFVSFFLFIKIGHEVFEKELATFDRSVSLFFYSLRDSALTKIMETITFLGSGTFLVPVSAIIIIFLFFRKHKRESLLFSIILAMGFILNILIKEIVKRPRPSIYPLVTESTYSFPSGHTMGSFVFYALIAYLIFHFTRNKKLAVVVSIISVFLIILIGISRIYLGVHFPSDVIAGFIVGFWWFITALLIRQTITFYRLYKKK